MDTRDHDYERVQPRARRHGGGGRRHDSALVLARLPMAFTGHLEDFLKALG
jgi:hypothetical protein